MTWKIIFEGFNILLHTVVLSVSMNKNPS